MMLGERITSFVGKHMTVNATRLDIYQTAIPMRGGFDHAAASRKTAESIVVRVAFSDGKAGWGETLPRDYVTGETPDSVVKDITKLLWPQVAKLKIPTRVGDATGEPWLPPETDGSGRCITAAACAVDLAMTRRIFANVTDIDLQLLAAISGRTRVRLYIDGTVSGVLGSSNPTKTARRLGLMRLIGMSDFKLKLGLGDDIDAANLRICHSRLGKAIARGNATLRVDYNGALDLKSAPQHIARLERFGVCVVEQPVFCTPKQLVALARKCELPLMADESLRTQADATELLAEPQRVWWNIRLSKNGGLIRALQLARLAAENGVRFSLGCMVGESSILSAAQRRFLQLGSHPRFIEGNYGRLLLKGDLTARSLRFGLGGRLKTLKGDGWGIRIDMDRVTRYGRLIRRLEA